jgi:uncharacterized membrane protein
LFSFLPSSHPFLVHFPIALFTVAVILDALSFARFRLGWLDEAAVTLYGIASLGSLVTAVTGKLSADALSPELAADALELVGRHGDWAFLTVLLFFAAFFFRLDVAWKERRRTSTRPSRARLVAVVVALMAEGSILVTAGLGGELVYRYGVGVASRPRVDRR